MAKTTQKQMDDDWVLVDETSVAAGLPPVPRSQLPSMFSLLSFPEDEPGVGSAPSSSPPPRPPPRGSYLR